MRHGGALSERDPEARGAGAVAGVTPELEASTLPSSLPCPDEGAGPKLPLLLMSDVADIDGNDSAASSSRTSSPAAEGTKPLLSDSMLMLAVR